MNSSPKFSTDFFSPQLRLISFFTLVFFLTAHVSASPISTKATPEPKAVPNPQPLSGISIPSELGRIEEVNINSDASPIVILIQNAHAVPDAQRKIQKLIEYLENQYGLDFVAVEGASSTLDAQIFKSFPDQKRLREVLDRYQQKGELNGALSAALLNPTKIPFYGMEDWFLYEEGIRLYQQSMKKESQISQKLKAKSLELNKRKKEIYSKELFKVDEALGSFQKNQKDFVATLKILSNIQMPKEGTELAIILEESRPNANSHQAMEIEVKKISQQVERILKKKSVTSGHLLREFHEKLQAFNTSQLSGQAFGLWLKEIMEHENIPLEVSSKLARGMTNQKKMRDMEGNKLLQDFKDYAQRVKEDLFQNSEQIALDRESRHLELMNKLIRLELSREDWEELKVESRKPFDSAQGGELAEPEKVESGKQPTDSHFLSTLYPLLSTHFKFYENASKRDETFSKNLFSRFDETHARRAAVIAGGFHSQGLMQHLKNQKISYVLLMPNINSIPEDSHYRDQMQGEISWKDYLEVENGKVSFYKAFVRATRDKLLHGAESMEHGKNEDPMPQAPSPMLKQWRDQIIRNLAKKEKLLQAGQYTRFIDEITETGFQTSLAEPFKKIDTFVDALKNLDAHSQLTGENLLKLLKPSTIETLLGSVTFPTHAASAELVPSIRFELRTEMRVGSDNVGSRTSANHETRSTSTMTSTNERKSNEPSRALITDDGSLARPEMRSRKIWTRILIPSALLLGVLIAGYLIQKKRQNRDQVPSQTIQRQTLTQDLPQVYRPRRSTGLTDVVARGRIYQPANQGYWAEQIQLHGNQDPFLKKMARNYAAIASLEERFAFFQGEGAAQKWGVVLKIMKVGGTLAIQVKRAQPGVAAAADSYGLFVMDQGSLRADEQIVYQKDIERIETLIAKGQIDPNAVGGSERIKELLRAAIGWDAVKAAAPLDSNQKAITRFVADSSGSQGYVGRDFDSGGFRYVTGEPPFEDGFLRIWYQDGSKNPVLDLNNVWVDSPISYPFRGHNIRIALRGTRDPATSPPNKVRVEFLNDNDYPLMQTFMDQMALSSDAWSQAIVSIPDWLKPENTYQFKKLRVVVLDAPQGAGAFDVRSDLVPDTRQELRTVQILDFRSGNVDLIQNQKSRSELRSFNRLNPFSQWPAQALIPFVLLGLRTESAELPDLKTSIAGADRQYLIELAKETQKGLDKLTDPATGWLVDYAPVTSGDVKVNYGSDGSKTSPTNIGLGIANIIEKRELGLISDQEALSKVTTALTTLQKSETYQGFFYNWYRLTGRTGQTPQVTLNHFVSSVDNGNLSAALVATVEAFPGTPASRMADQILNAQTYNLFYNKNPNRANTGMINHGFDTVSRTYSAYDYGILNTEARLMALIAIMKDGVPASAWTNQSTTVKIYTTSNGTQIPHVAAWSGSLFEGTYADEFLNGHRIAPQGWGENSTRMVTIHQDRGAEISNNGIWGFSPGQIPGTGGRYEAAGIPEAAYNAFQGTFVTTYSVALALPYKPKQAVAAFKAMEKLSPKVRNSNYGFTDSIDPKAGGVNENILGLDKGMEGLAIGNALIEATGTGKPVYDYFWQYFERRGKADRGRQILKSSETHPSFTTKVRPAGSSDAPSAAVTPVNSLDVFKTGIRSKGAFYEPGKAFALEGARNDPERGQVITASYDVGSTYSGIALKTAPVVLSEYQNFSVDTRGITEYPESVKLEFKDRNGGFIQVEQIPVTGNWQTVTRPIVPGAGTIAEMTFVFEAATAGAHPKGKVEFSNLILSSGKVTTKPSTTVEPPKETQPTKPIEKPQASASSQEEMGKAVVASEIPRNYFTSIGRKLTNGDLPNEISNGILKLTNEGGWAGEGAAPVRLPGKSQGYQFVYFKVRAEDAADFKLELKGFFDGKKQITIPSSQKGKWVTAEVPIEKNGGLIYFAVSDVTAAMELTDLELSKTKRQAPANQSFLRPELRNQERSEWRIWNRLIQISLAGVLCLAGCGKKEELSPQTTPFQKESIPTVPLAPSSQVKTPLELAQTEPLTQPGYENVANTGVVEAVKTYIRRFYQILDEGSLSGFAPHYTKFVEGVSNPEPGKHPGDAARPLTDMLRELDNSRWAKRLGQAPAPKQASAPVNARSPIELARTVRVTGINFSQLTRSYAQVAETGDVEAVKTFISRIARINDQGALSGFAPHYTKYVEGVSNPEPGKHVGQSPRPLSDLVRELNNSSWAKLNPNLPRSELRKKWQVALSLAVAFVTGLWLGGERQYRRDQKEHQKNMSEMQLKIEQLNTHPTIVSNAPLKITYNAKALENETAAIVKKRVDSLDEPNRFFFTEAYTDFLRKNTDFTVDQAWESNIHKFDEEHGSELKFPGPRYLTHRQVVESYDKYGEGYETVVDWIRQAWAAQVPEAAALNQREAVTTKLQEYGDQSPYLALLGIVYSPGVEFLSHWNEVYGKHFQSPTNMLTFFSDPSRANWNIVNDVRNDFKAKKALEIFRPELRDMIKKLMTGTAVALTVLGSWLGYEKWAEKREAVKDYQALQDLGMTVKDLLPYLRKALLSPPGSRSEMWQLKQGKKLVDRQARMPDEGSKSTRVKRTVIGDGEVNAAAFPGQDDVGTEPPQGPASSLKSFDGSGTGDVGGKFRHTALNSDFENSLRGLNPTPLSVFVDDGQAGTNRIPNIASDLPQISALTHATGNSGAFGNVTRHVPLTDKNGEAHTLTPLKRNGNSIPEAGQGILLSRSEARTRAEKGQSETRSASAISKPNRAIGKFLNRSEIRGISHNQVIQVRPLPPPSHRQGELYLQSVGHHYENYMRGRKDFFVGPGSLQAAILESMRSLRKAGEERKHLPRFESYLNKTDQAMRRLSRSSGLSSNVQSLLDENLKLLQLIVDVYVVGKGQDSSNRAEIVRDDEQVENILGSQSDLLHKYIPQIEHDGIRFYAVAQGMWAEKRNLAAYFRASLLLNSITFIVDKVGEEEAAERSDEEVRKIREQNIKNIVQALLFYKAVLEGGAAEELEVEEKYNREVGQFNLISASEVINQYKNILSNSPQEIGEFVENNYDEGENLREKFGQPPLSGQSDHFTPLVRQLLLDLGVATEADVVRKTLEKIPELRNFAKGHAELAQKALKESFGFMLTENQDQPGVLLPDLQTLLPQFNKLMGLELDSQTLSPQHREVLETFIAAVRYQSFHLEKAATVRPGLVPIAGAASTFQQFLQKEFDRLKPLLQPGDDVEAGPDRIFELFPGLIQEVFKNAARIFLQRASQGSAGWNHAVAELPGEAVVPVSAGIFLLEAEKAGYKPDFVKFVLLDFFALQAQRSEQVLRQTLAAMPRYDEYSLSASSYREPEIEPLYTIYLANFPELYELWNHFVEKEEQFIRTSFDLSDEMEIPELTNIEKAHRLLREFALFSRTMTQGHRASSAYQLLSIPVYENLDYDEKDETMMRSEDAEALSQAGAKPVIAPQASARFTDTLTGATAKSLLSLATGEAFEAELKVRQPDGTDITVKASAPQVFMVLQKTDETGEITPLVSADWKKIVRGDLDQKSAPLTGSGEIDSVIDGRRVTATARLLFPEISNRSEVRSTEPDENTVTPEEERKRQIVIGGIINQDLFNHDPNKQKEAAERLVRLRAVNAIESLHRALILSHAREGRVAMIEALAALNAQNTKPTIKKLLADTASPVRAASYKALRAMGESDVDLKRELFSLLNDPKLEVVQFAIDHLLSDYPENDTSIEDALHERLSEITPESFHQIQGILITALGNGKSIKSISLIIKKLNSSEKGLRLRSTEALGRIGHKDAIEPLMVRLRDPEPAIRKASRESLNMLEVSNRELEQRNLEALRHPDRQIRLEALNHLKELTQLQGGDALIQALIPLVEDLDFHPRTTANMLLKSLASPQQLTAIYTRVLNKQSLPFGANKRMIDEIVTLRPDNAVDIFLQLLGNDALNRRLYGVILGALGQVNATLQQLNTAYIQVLKKRNKVLTNLLRRAIIWLGDHGDQAAIEELRKPFHNEDRDRQAVLAIQKIQSRAELRAAQVNGGHPFLTAARLTPRKFFRTVDLQSSVPTDTIRQLTEAVLHPVPAVDLTVTQADQVVYFVKANGFDALRETMRQIARNIETSLPSIVSDKVWQEAMGNLIQTLELSESAQSPELKGAIAIVLPKLVSASFAHQLAKALIPAQLASVAIVGKGKTTSDIAKIIRSQGVTPKPLTDVSELAGSEIPVPTGILEGVLEGLPSDIVPFTIQGDVQDPLVRDYVEALQIVTLIHTARILAASSDPKALIQQPDELRRQIFESFHKLFQGHEDILSLAKGGGYAINAVAARIYLQVRAEQRVRVAA